MKRLTEYHNGVAVIKDKSKHKEAMEKLASYEDIEKECDMEKITTEMAEYICDMCCGNLDDVRSQEDADEICDECKLSKFIKDICISYNKLNTFVGSQVEHLLKKEYELKRELKSYKYLEEQGLLLKLPCKVGDVVYKIWSCGKSGKSVAEFGIKHIDIDFLPEIEFSFMSTKQKSGSYWFCKNSDFGKTIFLTKAEAEKALAEMKGE